MAGSMNQKSLVVWHFDWEELNSGTSEGRETFSENEAPGVVPLEVCA